VNYDIQGANLLPSLQRTTFALGTETGGPAFQALVAKSAGEGPLEVHELSALFGQNRSDYVNFIGKQIPTVFFSDSTGPCYHTAQDEIGIVDFWKLRFQAKIGFDVVRSLSDGDRLPFVGGLPLANFEDAVGLAAVANRAIADAGRFLGAELETLLRFRDDLNAVVADGAANFGNDDITTVLLGAIDAVSLLTSGACDGFLK
jgi:hypothetical protein